ncbi:hypothetical protein ONS95_005942 [Cadophora gregata]|uniref:uncharacterized protein n=1 Tax=Cadophora gregata TaxID=51156 RepID=UPI0026DB8E00|nr:uncharacterized protein ONS95_005942 [Cadophora gregata]KAK0102319.1 hypothetical protein ONS95_005942 [Cadophora gregata]
MILPASGTCKSLACPVKKDTSPLQPYKGRGSGLSFSQSPRPGSVCSCSVVNGPKHNTLLLRQTTQAQESSTRAGNNPTAVCPIHRTTDFCDYVNCQDYR